MIRLARYVRAPGPPDRRSGLGCTRQRAVLALVALAGFGFGLPLVPPAQAGPADPADPADPAVTVLTVSSAGYRVIAVAGSSKYLVYTKFPINPVTGRRESMGEVEVMTRSGVSRALGQITSHTAGWSLSGSTLFDVTLSRPQSVVHLWNVRTGHQTAVTALSDASGIAAAPHGYLVKETATGGSHAQPLGLATADGSLTQLGDPYPHGASYQVTVGPTSYVTWVDQVGTTAAIKTATFTSPHTIHTLVPRGDHASLCGPPTTRYVACWFSPNGNGAPNLRLYSLGGTLIARTSIAVNRNAAPAVLTRTALWIGGSVHYLYQLGPNGHVTKSKRTYSNVPPIQALHEVVVSTHPRTALIGLTGATAKPRTLVPGN
jgi:hypothetical protein